MRNTPVRRGETCDRSRCTAQRADRHLLLQVRPHRILGDDSLRLLLRHSHEREPGGDIGGHEVEPLHTLKDVRKHPTNALQEPGVTSAAECTVAVQCMQSDG